MERITLSYLTCLLGKVERERYISCNYTVADGHRICGIERTAHHVVTGHLRLRLAKIQRLGYDQQ